LIEEHITFGIEINTTKQNNRIDSAWRAAQSFWCAYCIVNKSFHWSSWIKFWKTLCTER